MSLLLLLLLLLSLSLLSCGLSISTTHLLITTLMG